MSTKIRGVQSIKTIAAVRGAGSYSNERHVHQFQLASLELDRTRRTREKQTALRRVAELDEKLIEIDVLIKKRQEALGLVSFESPDQLSVGVVRSETGAETMSVPRRVLRY